MSELSPWFHRALLPCSSSSNSLLNPLPATPCSGLETWGTAASQAPVPCMPRLPQSHFLHTFCCAPCPGRNMANTILMGPSGRFPLVENSDCCNGFLFLSNHAKEAREKDWVGCVRLLCIERRGKVCKARTGSYTKPHFFVTKPSSLVI